MTLAHDSCKDGPTRSRYLAVRLYGAGYPVKEVMNITGCSRSSLMNWCRFYSAEGVDGLSDKRVGGNRARLTPAQLDEVRTRLHTYGPGQLFGRDATNAQFWTVSDFARGLQRWYGVVYQSLSSYTRLILGCSPNAASATSSPSQQPKKVYKSRSDAKVAEFEAQLEKNWSTSLRMPPRR